MRNIPIIKSKLSIPQLPAGIIVQERLQFLCDEMSSRQAVIITAPAGYGKTTLMATALNQYKSKGCRIRWYRLDKEDRDLAVFYTHLLETLFPEEDALYKEARISLADCGDIFTRHGYINALICQEFWAWHELHAEQKTFIGFDDFQEVLDTPEVVGAIQFLLDNLPESCTLLISSRWETSLLAGKRRLEKDIMEVTHRDLCFSAVELAGLIKKKAGIISDQNLLHKIMLHTEGWAAGIILVCQILRQNGADQVSVILNRSGGKEPFFQYIAVEVLKTVEENLLSFLIKAAILPEFSVAEFEAIFDDTNALESIKLCEQKGLFIQKIFGASTTYRFHSLFRESLQQLQSQYLSPDEINNYHLKAAAYYIEHSNFSRAVEHFIACNNSEQAAALVARESARLIAFEAVDQIRIWFTLLPDEAVLCSGHLLFIKSFIHYQRDLDYTMQLLEQALAIFKQTNDINMQMHTFMKIGALHVFRNDVTGLNRFYTEAKELYGRVQEPTLKDSVNVLGSVCAIFGDQLSRGLALATRLESLVLPVDWEWVAYMYPALAEILLGNVDRAEGQMLECLRNTEYLKRAVLFKGYCQILYTGILHMKDDLQGFSGQINELLETGERYNYLYILAFANRLAALDSYRRHDLEGALDHIDASTRYWEELGNPAMASSNTLYRCLWLCQIKNLGNHTVNDHRRSNNGKLLAEAKKALKALTTAPTGMCLHDIGLSILGAIAREAGNFKLATRSLNAAVRRSRSKGAKQILAGSYLHLAKLYYDSGDDVQGDNYLQQAFDIAEDKQYAMFWDLHFPTIVEMAGRCIKSRIHASYALTLIARYYGEEAAEYLSRKAASISNDGLGGVVEAFMSLYGQGEDQPATQVSVNLFGKFEIRAGEVSIPETECKTRKILGILKYLLVNRGRTVSRDHLMALFWPESDQHSALYSLRAALYELRKVLRKYELPMDGSTAFLNEKRDSIGVRIGHGLSVDVDEFLKNAEELKQLPLSRDGIWRRKIILEQMVAIYRGDLLEEDGYDWTYAEKEELRSLYFTCVLELVNLYINDRNNSDAERLLLQALTRDPYHEEVCLALLKLYAAANQRARAVRLYSDFASRFESELHIKPDERLIMEVMILGYK